MNFVFYYKINQLTQQNPPVHTTIKTDTSQQPGLKFLTAIPAMVTKNIITLEGEAPENTVICLLQNGKIEAVTLSQNGKFTFKNVTLSRNLNKIVIKAISDSGRTVDLEELAITFNSPTLDYLARDFTRGEISLKKIALTFDGDFLDNNALPILDVLKAKNIKATFFLTGRFIQNYTEIIRRMLQDGHEIGNHTRHHPHLTTFEQTRKHDLRPEVKRELVHRELEETAVLFKKVTGSDISPLWRAPYGEHNELIRRWAAELGYRQIGWTFDRKLKLSLDTFDWVADKNSQLYRTPEQILHHIIQFDEKSEAGLNGGIVLMHLGSERNGEFPYQILGHMIDSLQARGYEFTKISSMPF
ncbi:polysaccharide deacetylase family protein [candidate division KSB1 bacterium]|nr:polysaccharide deacetylase family protein [candidate division KSB1 bacterium]